MAEAARCAVLLVPVDHGVLVLRLPGSTLALPSAAVEGDEPWQTAVTRALCDETAILVDPRHVRTLTARTSADGQRIVFGLAPKLRALDLPTFIPTERSNGRFILAPHELAQLASPIHAAVVAAWWRGEVTPEDAG